jgi:chemotaxis response regulator CheB
VPEQSGLAFVVVQHLDPTHKDMMAELLARMTPMKVLQIKDRLKVEPNFVYVIPPNKDLSILRGSCTPSRQRRRAGCACPSTISSAPWPPIRKT